MTFLCQSLSYMLNVDLQLPVRWSQTPAEELAEGFQRGVMAEVVTLKTSFIKKLGLCGLLVTLYTLSNLCFCMCVYMCTCVYVYVYERRDHTFE